MVRNIADATDSAYFHNKCSEILRFGGTKIELDFLFIKVLFSRNSRIKKKLQKDLNNKLSRAKLKYAGKYLVTFKTPSHILSFVYLTDIYTK